jgi:hypothetical protein
MHQKKPVLENGASLHMCLGTESWTLDADCDKGDSNPSSHHKSIRRILNINILEVEAERITNTKLRRKFDNIRNISEFANER